MTQLTNYRAFYCLLAAVFLSACAGTETIVDSPSVKLASVELTDADFNSQTFLLSFDVNNPNPFPLPVKAVTYRILFDDEKFAGGETKGSFTVPARGDDAFAISVDLDVLNSVTHLTSFLRGGMRDQVSYELRGSLAVDIPFVRPIPFSSSGVIRIKQ